MHEGIKITWYGYIAIGFGAGVYLHCHLIRHWLHLLAIAILRGFIWMLQRTDIYHKEPRDKPIVSKPKTSQTIPIKGERKDGIEISEGELERWLDNPEVSVVER